MLLVLTLILCSCGVKSGSRNLEDNHDVSDGKSLYEHGLCIL